MSTHSIAEVEAAASIGETQRDSLAPLNEPDVPETAVSLPPMDEGFGAYSYLVAAFVVEFLAWAIPFSYGVFLDYYTSELFGLDDPQLGLLPIAGTFASGIMYLASLPALAVMNRFPAHKPTVGFAGLGLCVAALVGAAFSSRPIHLVLTQGILYSIGGTLFYFPVATYLPEWFSKKRGLANGIVFSGTGLGGVVVPFIVDQLLHKAGHRITFLALASGFAVLGFAGLYYAKPRLPLAQAGAIGRFDTSFVYSRVFWVLLAGNTIQGFANFLPGIYIPSFASKLRLNTTSGALALALMNTASVPGLIIIGTMTDKLDLRVSIATSTIGAAIAVLVVWGFTNTLAPLLVFASLYGFCAGGYSSMWPKFIGVVSTEDKNLYNTLYGIFVASRGLGNVLSGPISTGLMKQGALANLGHAQFGYSLDGYGTLILYSGVMMLASTIGVLYPHFVQSSVGSSMELGHVGYIGA